MERFKGGVMFWYEGWVREDQSYTMLSLGENASLLSVSVRRYGQTKLYTNMWVVMEDEFKMASLVVTRMCL